MHHLGSKADPDVTSRNPRGDRPCVVVHRCGTALNHDIALYAPLWSHGLVPLRGRGARAARARRRAIRPPWSRAPRIFDIAAGCTAIVCDVSLVAERAFSRPRLSDSPWRAEVPLDRVLCGAVLGAVTVVEVEDAKTAETRTTCSVEAADVIR